MKQRLIASGVVFAVGFGIGLGLTWALLAETPSNEDAAASRDMADGATEPAPVSPDDEVAVAAEGRTPEADEPAVETESEAAASADDEPASDEEPTAEADTPPTGDTPTTETEGAVAEGDSPDPTAPAGAAAPGAEPAEEVEPRSNAWWKGLVGKRCRVDLGRAKALTIRRGDLEEGEKLDWVTRFGTNPRIGLLSAAETTIVTVHGVATNAGGTPVAAKITLTRQGVDTTGIIALHTQGLRVTLYPVDEGTATP